MKNQKGIIHTPLLITIVIVFILVIGVWISIASHKEEQKREGETLAPQIEPSQETKNLKEEEGSEGEIENPIIKVERCKIEAEIKAEKFLKESIEKSVEKCRAEHTEETRTMFGLSPCYIPSKEAQEEARKKYYNQFYLDCLNQL
jgi:hypothetical protein